MNNEIMRIKNCIISENKNNTGARRQFSQRIKRSTIKLINDNNLSSSNASQLLGIGNTTIEKWRRNHKEGFKKISISKPKITTIKKKEQDFIKFNQILFNQKVVIFLLALLLVEKISLH